MQTFPLTSDDRDLMTLVKTPCEEKLSTAFLLDQDVNATSMKHYFKGLRQYFTWLSDNEINLRNVDRSTIIRYKHDLISRGLSALSVAAYLSVVRCFYTWAEAHKHYPNVAAGVKSPRTERKFKKRPLSAKQASDLLEYFEGNPRDYAIVSLCLRTGLRTIEVTRANISDIEIIDGKKVLHIQGKGKADKSDYVVLTDKCYLSIAEYLGTRESNLTNEPLFVSQANRNHNERLTTHSIRVLVKKGLRAIGLDNHSYTAHSLRHSCATIIIESGGSIVDAQKVLRHSSSVTTEMYTEMINEKQRFENPPELLLDDKF